jgi:diguanylate cyclase (GGDEF)-like protein/putative nucleotidyltransferase with HDIG domain
MVLRSKALVGMVVAGAVATVWSTFDHPARHWLHFFVYLTAILLSSRMKVAMPKSEGTMSVNFPFIFLGILQLSPLQVIALAACSVIAQCRIEVVRPFTLVQILFNVANVITATVLAWVTYVGLLRLHVEIAPALALAATAYFFANTIPVALIIGWESRVSAFAQWRQNYPWYLPFYVVGAMLAATANFIGVEFGWMTSLLLIPMVYTVYRAYRAQMAMIRDREQHALETEALHLRTIEALAMAVEAKDQNTHRHLMRVRVYVSELGKIMGLDKPSMQALETAAFLHDIGKLAVPEHIINKPGKLTHDEFEKMKIHPVVGADILKRIRFPYPVVPIVRSHHEAWDGSGYPDGLRAEGIPIGARILTAVDCFDAMASERPYRKALPLNEAMAHLKSRAGVQFDAEVVQLLEEHYPRLEELARQQIEEIEPLKTDLFIVRGAAPGAGFAPEHSDDDAQPGDGDQVGPNAFAAKLHSDSLNMVAEASREAKALLELSQMMGSSLSAGEICAMMCRRLQPLVPFDCFALYLKAESSLLAQHIDGPCALSFSSEPIPLGEGLSGWVAHNERPIVNGNPTVEPNLVTDGDLFTANSSALSVPLSDLSGVVFGVLTIYSRRNAAFSKDHLRVVRAMLPSFSLSLQNVLRSQPSEVQGDIDELTQLPGMKRFFHEIDREIRNASENGSHFGVVVCGLNSFKAMNEQHGRAFGSQLLKLVADAFRDCCRPGDTVGRIGEDEFVFLFPSMDIQSVHRPLDMVEEAVQRACADLRVDVPISTNIGAAFYPADGDTPEVLLAIAERRMYLHQQTFPEPIGSSERQAAVASLPVS